MSNSLYAGISHRRVTVLDIAAAKERGEKWAMLTSYDQMTAEIFEEAGIPALLVGDSAANTVLGYQNTIGVTVDELIPLTRAVVRATSRAMVIADLPFGSYEGSPSQALETATRFFKEAGAHAVKLEGGARVLPHRFPVRMGRSSGGSYPRYDRPENTHLPPRRRPRGWDPGDGGLPDPAAPRQPSVEIVQPDDFEDWCRLFCHRTRTDACR